MAASIARSLAGKTALVTGSSSGIGLGIASVLASKGANVVVHGVGTMDEIDRVAQAIADKHDVKCAASNANLLMGEEPVKAMVELSQATFDRPIDILVNNAGIQVRAFRCTALHACPYHCATPCQLGAEGVAAEMAARPRRSDSQSLPPALARKAGLAVRRHPRDCVALLPTPVAPARSTCAPWRTFRWRPGSASWP